MFSVLMVIHKSDNLNHLKECLVSLERQTLLPNEIIIVSDGDVHFSMIELINSFDKLLIKLFKYSGSEKLPGALNMGIGQATNSIIARMDPDDICRPERFEIQIPYFVDAKPSVLGANTSEFFDDVNIPIGHRRVKKKPSLRDCYKQNPVNHMTATFNREDIESVGGYSYVECFEDWHLWLKLVKNGKTIINQDQVLVDVRVGNGFLKRRSGVKYAIREYRALTKFYFDDLIPFYFYSIGLIFRLPVRLLPEAIRKLVYKKLRTK